MTESFPANSRAAILGFHFADRLKAGFILASQLLEVAIHLPEPEAAGARQLYQVYLRALEQEMSLCQSVIKDPELLRVQTVLSGLAGRVADGQLKDVQAYLTWMITIITTYAQRSMAYLQQQQLL
ncbi:MAG: hypothetical protein BZ151_01950 [Desulfobacca sp. 4484_104]|nr:MAG: hypothetical protein BZ151_01950 [Desulfobacca sp. 4484_104]RLA90291.1 MAG: hypothetical protein DRG58_02720 [Deltaproteobacteria bacterium]